MVIDFHTHIFPDKIAEKTMSFLSSKGGYAPFSAGTVDGLLSETERADIDMAVTLPVVTAPKQFDSINRFAHEINERFSESGKILSFGGIHPACEDIRGKMKQLRDMGFKGVKIHPDYQETYINDGGYVEILKNAKELDMIVATHAGVDGGYRDRDVMCPPERVLDLIEKVPYSKLVLAHMGGNEMFSEVLKALAGKDVYFDTAYVLRYIGEDMFKKILSKHGEDKILFATDSPWSGICEDVKIIKSFGLSETAERKIFSENAIKLLGIQV